MPPFHARRTRLYLAPALVALGALSLLAACGENVVAPTRPQGDAPGTVAPHALGLVEVTFSGIGTSGMHASVRHVTSGAMRPSASAPGTTAPALHLAVSPVSGGDGSIQLEPLATGSFTDGVRGSGGVRYLYATFKVRNAQDDGTAYATPRTNLTFLGVAGSSTLHETAIKSMERFDGSDASDAIATAFIPTGGVARNAATGAIEPNGADVLQVLTEAEAGAVTRPAGVTTVFPYGFVVRNPSAADGRTLTENPAADQFDGVVTFAYKVPLQASAADDPFTVTADFLAVDDGETRITESLVEQGTGSVTAGVDALDGTASVTLLGNSTTLVPGHGVRRICRVRTAGTDAANPTATLVDASGCTEGTVTLPTHVRVVDAGAGAGGAGQTWSSAFATLQDALACVRDEAGSGEACEGVDEIWVAAGTYYPDEGAGQTDNDWDARFAPVEGVSLYGGFAGNEYNRDQRDWTTNVTILDGDIDQNGTALGNSTTIVFMNASGGAQITPATVVDGFTVRHDLGGPVDAAIDCHADGAGSVCSPVLRNLIVTGNEGTQAGALLIAATAGGVARPLVNDVTFSHDTAGNGGAVFIFAQTSSEASPTFVHVTFDGNVANSSGGAVYARGVGGTMDVRFVHSAFRNNVAASSSASNGGAVSLVQGGTLRFIDTELWNNTVRTSVGGPLSGRGGAITIGAGHIELANVTLANNGAADHGNIAIDGGTLTLDNTIIWGNTNPGSLPGSVTATNSLIEGGCPSGATCTGVIGTDPQFIDMAGGDLRLGGASPAVDAGTNTLLPPDTFDLDGDGNTTEVLPLDMADRPRVVDWGGDGTATVDMGAYERQ